MSPVGVALALGMLAFLGFVSAVLLWDGLAEVRNGHTAVHEHARARLVVGALGFAAVLWLVIGLLSHAH